MTASPDNQMPVDNRANTDAVDNKSVLLNERGFALIWVLVVIFVIFVTGSIVAWRSFQHYQQTVTRALDRRAHWLARTGINRQISRLNSLDRDFATLLDNTVFDTVSSTETIRHELIPWAGVLLVISTGKVGVRSVTEAATIGQVSDLPDSVVIRTRHTQYPLVISGSSRVAGKVVSVAGAPVAGKFQGRGPAQQSIDSLAFYAPPPPEFDFWLFDYELGKLRSLSETRPITLTGNRQFIGTNLSSLFEDDYAYIEGNLDLVSCTLEIYDHPRHLLVNGQLTINDNSRLDGLLKVYARGGIVIEGRSLIDGVSLVSEETVEITGYAHLRANILSRRGVHLSGSAILENGTTLTTILSLKNGRELPVHSVTLATTGKINACIASFVDESKVNPERPRIRIDSMVAFTGSILSNHAVELETDVTGQIDISHFRFERPPTTYVNWLVDSRVIAKSKSLPDIVRTTDLRYGRLRSVTQ